jgi:hypothetical protein
MKSLQKFASVHGSIHNHFNQERHLIDRQTYKERRAVTLAEGMVGAVVQAVGVALPKNRAENPV